MREESQREEVLWQCQARRHHCLLVVGVGWGQD